MSKRMTRCVHASFACTVALVLMTVTERAIGLSKMDAVYTWDQITFVFDNNEQRKQLEDKGVLIRGDSAPFDVDSHKDTGNMFISMPHVLPGSAVTLATVENSSQRFNPRLRPYPNWSWHANNSGCDGLTSVYRMEIDDCGRLWVIDSGVDVSLGRFNAVCPPQLVVFNLTTNEVITRHRFPIGQCDASLMVTVVTERMDNLCSDDVYAYIADATSNQITVYHMRTQRSWRVPSFLFYPEVGARNFVVNDVPFSMMIGVLGLALSPCSNAPCDRYLFFHSFSGLIEGRVKTSLLRNASLFLNGTNGTQYVKDVIGSRPKQAAAQAMSREGYLFFGLLGDNTLNCWNYRTPYKKGNINVVEYDKRRISMPLGIKVKTDEQGAENVIFISSNMQTFFSRNYTANSTYPINVIKGKVNKIVRGTDCKIQRIRG